MSQNKNNDESKKEAINIVIKIKEKEINEAINKMNYYKKENELLKRELYKNDDYTNKLELEDYSNENKKKIEMLSDEIRILNNQLEAHKKCLHERNLLNKEYIELKKNLQDIKKNIKNVKNLIKEKELDKNNIGIIETLEDNMTNNNLSPRANQTKIIKNTFLYPTSRNKIPYLNLSKSYKNTILPTILSPTYYKYDKNILSKEFYTKLKKHYEGRENEYDALLEKITETENSRNFIENKHKNEIKQFNTQICTLDEQFKILNNDSKGTGSNIRVLKYKLNTTKNEAKHLLAQIQKLKVKLDFAINISKERDHKIHLLKGQINTLKTKELKIKKEEMEKEKEKEKIKEREEKNSIKSKEKATKNSKRHKDKSKKDSKSNKDSSKSKNKKNKNKENINKDNESDEENENKKKVINMKKELSNIKNKKSLKLNLKE